MKTFKLISANIIRDNVEHIIPLIDGIIINQENITRSWILELFIDKQHHALFTDLQSTNEKILAKAVISYPDNEPAHFEVVVYSVKEIGEHISVLLRGNLNVVRRKYAESLLAQLIEDGLSGEELLFRFEHDMKARPSLKKE